MPELPELKSMRRQIARNTISKKIVDFKVNKLKLSVGSIDDFKNKTINSYFKKVDCLGETIVFKLSSSYYISVNMQSTGYFVYVPVDSKEDYKNIKAEFIFSDGSRLIFIDYRPYSYFKLLLQKQLNKSKLNLGIDPLGKSFNYSVFLKLLKNRSTSIKNFLTNDDVLFGIGKVYADEICFEARINPNRGMKTLKKSEINRIYTATKKMLKKSMEYDGLSIYLPVSYKKLRFDRFLKVYEREGEKCKRCNGTIKKEKIVKPTYFFCPLCQN